MFNALKYTKILEESGFTKEQAETSIKVLIEMMNQNFVTNENLKITEFALKTDIDQLRMEFKSDINHLRAEMMEEFDIVRDDIRNIKIEINDLKNEMKLLDQKIDIVSDKLVIRLSGIMIIVMGLFKYLG